MFEVEIARAPPAEVFAMLTDTGRLHEVDPALVEYGPPGPLATASEGWFKHRRIGMTARTTFRVLVFEPPQRLEVAITGMGYQMTEAAQLEQTPRGTRAQFVDRVWPTSLAGRVLVSMSGGIMRRNLRARSARLKSMLEAGAAT